jgi:hypothetical protein
MGRLFLRLALLACLLLILFPLQSDANLSWDFSGTMEMWGEYYPKENPNCPDCDEWVLITKLKPRLVLESGGEKFKFVIEPVVNGNTSDYARGILNSYTHRYPDRFRSVVDLHEFYIELKPFSWSSMGVGIRDFEKGAGERINPTNTNPYDWIDPIKFETFGMPAGWVKLWLKDFYVEGVISKFIPSRLPLDFDNRWRLELLKNFIVDEPEIPKDLQYSVKVGISKTRVKSSLIYFKGFSQFPEFRLSGLPAVGFPELVPDNFRMEMFGASLLTSLFGLGLRGEVGYFSQDGADDYIQWVVGIDKLWFWRDSELYVLFQYVGEHITKDVDPLQRAYDLRRIFKDSLMGKFKLNIKDWEISLGGVWNLDRGDHFLQSQFAYLWKDWKIYLSYDYLNGHKGEGFDTPFFGQHKDNSRVILGANFNWSFFGKIFNSLK